MKIPTIHLNGTSAQSLMDDLENAHEKIREAIQALSQCAPNGRDYYVQESGALVVAQEEHQARMSKLVSIKAELEALAEGIDAQRVRR